jgi:hypothetical protein
VEHLKCAQLPRREVADTVHGGHASSTGDGDQLEASVRHLHGRRVARERRRPAPGSMWVRLAVELSEGTARGSGQKTWTRPSTCVEPPSGATMMAPPGPTDFGWQPAHWVMLVTPA